uniref:SH2 domain-containing protein n=1 Tax=Acrobeloides nanus TaxID=290746 RepID=A0A914DJF7_9BILA
MFATFNQGIMGNLFKNSIIVSKHPPSIITMFEQRSFNASQNNGDNKKRRSRFWFDTELRLLGGQAWKQIKEINIFGVTAGVRLLTEDVGEQKFVIEPNHANFDVLTSPASFNDMRILKSEKRPRGVKDRRYAIVYEVNASYFGTIYKMSLPFSIVNGEPEFEKDTDVFMERSFADLAFQISLEEEALNQGKSLTFDAYQKQLNLKNISLAKERVVEALELKFRRIFEKRVSDKERDDDKEKVQHRVFNQKDKDHIANMLQIQIPGHLSQKGLECNCRLCQNIKEGQLQDSGKIFLNSLTEHVVAMKYATHNGNSKSNIEACTFIEWFYKIAEMVSVCKTYWASNEVFGFCDQTTTEALLIAHPGNIMIRFADTVLGQLRLSMKDGSNLHRTRHITVKYTENSENSLDSFNDELQFFKIVKTAARQYGIYYIYPNFKINMPEINEDQPVDCTPLDEYNKNTYALNEAKKRSH